MQCLTPSKPCSRDFEAIKRGGKLLGATQVSNHVCDRPTAQIFWGGQPPMLVTPRYFLELYASSIWLKIPGGKSKVKEIRRPPGCSTKETVHPSGQVITKRFMPTLSRQMGQVLRHSPYGRWRELCTPESLH
ncbi:hypothetical protein Naga_100022g35 [Nannochloropsis gaditana]|uniref:Uncharacterized protein n=1 Tax=Nannochloropsis gaditana TaxID=72520 RepID=W7U1S2_9STRA|nr:hypothetical protein Naga_100022g35 [Nannochloropsis gaditana]